MGHPPRPVDAKKDEDEQVKFQEIVDLLVASGYFRARIKGLSPFDKVVGGMVWCISVCSFEIDVDIFFKENSTIGQKIALTEKLVWCLKEMACPHPLQPHQIQGLDFVHIFPVVQWLVKMAMESRRGGCDVRRQRALHHFYNQHSCLAPRLSGRESRSLLGIKQVEKMDEAERKWRRVDGGAWMDEDKRIHSVLLEYGRKGWLGDTGGPDDDSKSSSTQQTCAQQEVTELMGQMTSAHSTKGPSGLPLMNHALQQIHSLSRHYSAQTQQVHTHETHSLPHLHNLHTQLSHALKLLQSQKETLEKEEEEVNELLNKLLGEEERLVAVEKEMQELEEDASNKGDIEVLSEWARMREEVRNEGSTFQQQCQEERSRLQASIEGAKLQAGSSEDQDRQLVEVDEELRAGVHKLNKIRILLARKNREVAALQRSMDDTPSRQELSQYQARFVELHNQVAQKHKETKQFFNLHNTADDTRLYLDKEVNLLNSVHDNFEKGMSSEAGKEAFMRQLHQVVEGVVTNKNKIELKREEWQARLRVMEGDLERLRRQEAMYYAAVKVFQEECRRQEVLMHKLATRQADHAPQR